MKAKIGFFSEKSDFDIFEKIEQDILLKIPHIKDRVVLKSICGLMGDIITEHQKSKNEEIHKNFKINVLFILNIYF